MRYQDLLVVNLDTFRIVVVGKVGDDFFHLDVLVTALLEEVEVDFSIALAVKLCGGENGVNCVLHFFLFPFFVLSVCIIANKTRSVYSQNAQKINV